MALRKFSIERDMPKVGARDRDHLRGAAARSSDALQQIGKEIQWVANNKTFCVYLAKDEVVIRKHFGAPRISCDQDHRDQKDDRSDNRELAYA